MDTSTLTLCAWCEHIIHEGVRDEDGGCSHGVCVRCLIERFPQFYTDAELKEMRDEVATWSA